MGLFDSVPEEVSLYEVGPRDGLQNEVGTVPTTSKLRLIDALIEAGLKRIEITSFVAPQWIPQLADADRVARAVKPRTGYSFSALCPNRKGLERARAAGMKEIAVFVSVSEAHNQRNLNRPVARTMEIMADLVPYAIAQGLRVRGYVSTVWGCPYEGETDPERSVAIARRLFELGCYEVSLGDTIGVGTPPQTKRILEMFAGELGLERIAMHMHDTRGQALLNLAVGLELGVRTFDCAIAGLGGCPYAPGASGNVASEDVLFFLDSLGVRTGIDARKLLEAGRIAEGLVQRELPGRVHRAGLRALEM